MDWNAIFQLPEACGLDMSIAKKTFMNHPDSTRSDSKLLKDPAVQQIRLFGKVSREGGNVPEWEDETVSFREILFIECTLAVAAFEKYKAPLAGLLHKLIPHHCVVVLQDDHQENNRLSLAEKRISRNSPDLRVVEKEYFSRDIKAENRLFLNSLAFSNAEKLNQKVYYTYLINCIQSFQLKEYGGTFKIRPYEVSREMIGWQNQIQVAEEEIEYEKKQLAKDSSMQEKVAVNTKIRQLKEEIKHLKQQINHQ